MCQHFNLRSRRSFIALNKPQHEHDTPIKIHYKTDSPHTIRNHDGWLSDMLNGFVKSMLGDITVEMAEKELLKNELWILRRQGMRKMTKEHISRCLRAIVFKPLFSRQGSGKGLKTFVLLQIPLRINRLKNSLDLFWKIKTGQFSKCCHRFISVFFILGSWSWGQWELETSYI